MSARVRGTGRGRQKSRNGAEAPLGSVPSMWHDLRNGRAAVYFLLAYLVFEYGRPQSIYPWLDGLPFASVCLVLSLLAALRQSPGRNLALPATGLLVAFALLVLVSSVAAYWPPLAYSNLYIFGSWALVYAAIVGILNTPRRWVLAMALFLLLSFKMSQHGLRVWVGRNLAFADWGLGGPGGWFQNSGELGVQMCVFLPLSIAFILAFRSHWGRFVRMVAWLMPLSAAATIIGSSSRGAVVGGVASVVPLVLRSRYKWKAMAIAAALAMVGYFLMPPEFMERFTTAGDDNTSVSRITRWKGGIDMMLEFPVLGVGYFNWEAYYPSHYEPYLRGGALSHNIFIQVGAELGLTGLMLFLLMIISCLRMTAGVCRHAMTDAGTMHYRHLATGLDGALLGYLASGFFVTVFFYPYFWVNLAFTVALYNVVVRGAAPGRTVAAWRPAATHGEPQAGAPVTRNGVP